MEKRFKFQEKQLLSHIDDKFETNRRLLVNEMQNFQDAIITEINTNIATSNQGWRFLSSKWPPGP